jgi:hypothetical protein
LYCYAEERWPEAAAEYSEIGVTPACLELAREMEPHVVGLVYKLNPVDP